MKIIFDFDSTLVTVEWLDTLAEYALAHHPQKQDILSRIQDITNKGMNGQMTFDQSLSQRMALLQADEQCIKRTQQHLLRSISPSLIENKEKRQQYRDHIYIVSWWFYDLILPVVHVLWRHPAHIFANDFIIEKGYVVWIDKTKLLSQDKGKVKAVKGLWLQWWVTVVGDGFTDYEIKKHGYANQFIAYTENAHRDKVVAVADAVVDSFEQVREFLH